MNNKGTTKCLRRICTSCPFINESPAIKFPNRIFYINDYFTCSSINVIYVIICKRCNKMYIGETGRRLSDRFHDHMLDIRTNKDTPVAVHFNKRDACSVNDISITCLQSCKGGKVTRLAMESQLILELGVLSPYGINRTVRGADT